MSAKNASSKTVAFPLPAVFANQQPVEIIGPDSTQHRYVLLTASLYNAAGFNVKVAPAAAGTVFPHVLVAWDQGRLNNAQDAQAHNVTLDLPFLWDIPKGERLWATFRGTNMGLAILTGGSIRLCMTVIPLLEPSVNGQTKTIIEGVGRVFRQSLEDVLPSFFTKRG